MWPIVSQQQMVYCAQFRVNTKRLVSNTLLGEKLRRVEKKSTAFLRGQVFSRQERHMSKALESDLGLEFCL